MLRGVLQQSFGSIRRTPLIWRTALIIGAVFAAWGIRDVSFVRALDNALLTARYSLTVQNKEFNSVLIAIDTRSLQSDPDWPWPRDRYANLLDRLNKAGAAQIAFDIDFSSRNNGDEDFAAAIGRSQAPVYLATFRQSFDGAPGVIAEIQPNHVIRQHGNLVTTTFPIDPDGIVREMPAQDMFSYGPVPQLALALNDRPPFEGLRTVDFAHDLREFPVISFSDVLRGAEIDDIVRGKTVFVGATAIELGDEFALPHLGLQSGVLLNMLAYESIRQHSEKSTAPMVVILFLVGIAVLAASRSVSLMGIRVYTILNISVLISVFLLGLLSQSFFDIVIPTALSHIAQLSAIALMLCVAADDYAAKIFRSHMNIRKHAAILDTMMSSNHDGIILVNRFGAVENCNEQASRLLGTDCRHMKDHDFAKVAPSIAGAQYDGAPVLIEIACAAGKTQYVEVSKSEVELPLARSRYEQRQEVRYLTLYTLHDLTAQKLAEQTERQAKEEHARASEAKSTLISTMSHELRTPLNSVCGFADLISTEAFGEHTSPEYAEFGGMISSSGKQLLGVINDMLLATQLQSGDVKLRDQRFPLSEVISAAIERASQRQSWSNPEIDVDVDGVTLQADYDLMTTAFYHLIDNASKFAKTDGRIRIGVTEDGILSISDNGPGLGGADGERLKQLFEQGDGSRTRAHEGCGLGLFLVSGIFDLHGISFTLEDGPEGGCQVACQMPGEVMTTSHTASAA